MSQQLYETPHQDYENPVGVAANGRLKNGAHPLASELAADVPQRRGSEPYDAALMRLRIRMNLQCGGGYALGITSCTGKSDASAFTANLAIRAADLHFGPVLLVDVHPQRNNLAKAFGAAPQPGLGEVLAGKVVLEEAVQQSTVRGLDLLTLGDTRLFARGSLEAERIESLVKELRTEYAVLCFNFSCAEELTSALLLGRQMDGFLLAVRGERTRKRQAEGALRRLKSDGINVIGAVMTHRRRFLPAWLEHRL